MWRVLGRGHIPAADTETQGSVARAPGARRPVPCALATPKRVASVWHGGRGSIVSLDGDGDGYGCGYGDEIIVSAGAEVIQM
jgi:hypothetical protein